ncbi:MAG: AAA family ATPase [Bacteroidia bacterium]|nr:AAA family ATPase [Bacteroidia bacterium]MDW8157600.1 AAA family ATPase [Bacteroidia bacterium]
MQAPALLPYGVSNFTKIAAQSYVFIDKTPCIELLEKNGENYVSLEYIDIRSEREVG